jgi:ABC-type transport system involved in multi-copper enzyme maturation permease subunit
MAWLPIVGRELRVASRRRATYWLRSLLVLGGCVLWMGLLATGSHAWAPGRAGQTLFTCVGILAFAFCLLAGVFLTSDCLSQERREGTLGLLFLTDLKSYDVVCGKLAAASLAAFFGLLSLFPILALPILIGGVTFGDFARVALVLMNTLLWSLCLGVMVSAICREVRHALSVALLLVIVLAGGVPLFWQVAFGWRSGLVQLMWLNWLSPGWSLFCAFDNTSFGARQFWQALGTVSRTERPQGCFFSGSMGIAIFGIVSSAVLRTARLHGSSVPLASS